MTRIRLSQRPPWCEPWGGLKRQSMFYLLAAATNLVRSSWRKLCVSSEWVPTMLVPLSDHTWSGLPLRATNRTSPLLKASVSSVGNISIWIARLVKHVYTQPYLLTWERPWTSLNGPNTSTPTQVKGRRSGWHRCGGKSAIFCTQGGEYNRLQTTQLRLILLIMGRAFTIQYFSRTWLSTHSLPRWALQWCSWQINSLTRWFFGRTIGFLALSNTSACLSLPRTTIRPLSNFGHNFVRLLDFDTWPRCWRSHISSA